MFIQKGFLTKFTIIQFNNLTFASAISESYHVIKGDAKGYTAMNRLIIIPREQSMNR
jgi:hypothetical protein